MDILHLNRHYLIFFLILGLVASCDSYTYDLIAIDTAELQVKQEGLLPTLIRIETDARTNIT